MVRQEGASPVFGSEKYDEWNANKNVLTFTYVQVYGEASVIFPILVAETFARRHAEFKAYARD